jgi:hypothetical protein
MYTVRMLSMTNRIATTEPRTGEPDLLTIRTGLDSKAAVLAYLEVSGGSKN